MGTAVKNEANQAHRQASTQQEKKRAGGIARPQTSSKTKSHLPTVCFGTSGWPLLTLNLGRGPCNHEATTCAGWQNPARMQVSDRTTGVGRVFFIGNLCMDMLLYGTCHSGSKLDRGREQRGVKGRAVCCLYLGPPSLPHPEP
jgi:hypothetical protein